MRGKTCIIITLFLLTSSCSTSKQNSTQNMEQDLISHEIIKDQPMQITDFKSLNELSFSEFSQNASICELPDNYYFSGSYLSDDNVLYGQVQDAYTNDIMLSSYDLNSLVFSIIEVNYDESPLSITVFGMYEDKLYYSLSNIQGHVCFMQYNLDTHQSGELFKQISCPAFDVSPIACNEYGFVINVFNDETEEFENRYYQSDQNLFTVIESSNCAYPVIFKNRLYYVKINNESQETSLISYDFGTKEKSELLHYYDDDMYISGLSGSNDYLIILISSSQSTSVYKINEDMSSEYLFQTAWMSSVRVNNTGLLTWLGERTSPDRIRMQNHLYDINARKKFDYSDSVVYLSNSGIAWIHMKKDDEEIEKGELFLPQNTNISFVKFRKES